MSSAKRRRQSVNRREWVKQLAEKWATKKAGAAS